MPAPGGTANGPAPGRSPGAARAPVCNRSQSVKEHEESESPHGDDESDVVEASGPDQNRFRPIDKVPIGCLEPSLKGEYPARFCGHTYGHLLSRPGKNLFDLGGIECQLGRIELQPDPDRIAGLIEDGDLDIASL